MDRILIEAGRSPPAGLTSKETRSPSRSPWTRSITKPGSEASSSGSVARGASAATETVDAPG